jgi:hypothetical protein
MKKVKFYRFRKIYFHRRKTIIAFLSAIILSFTYFFFNFLNSNLLIKFISENLWIQTIIMFLTISSLINIFFPFTIRKEIKLTDIEDISNKSIERYKEDLEFEKRLNNTL